LSHGALFSDFVPWGAFQRFGEFLRFQKLWRRFWQRTRRDETYTLASHDVAWRTYSERKFIYISFFAESSVFDSKKDKKKIKRYIRVRLVTFSIFLSSSLGDYVAVASFRHIWKYELWFDLSRIDILRAVYFDLSSWFCSQNTTSVESSKRIFSVLFANSSYSYRCHFRSCDFQGLGSSPTS
jgi:hypothetical protein